MEDTVQVTCFGMKRSPKSKASNRQATSLPSTPVGVACSLSTRPIGRVGTACPNGTPPRKFTSRLLSPPLPLRGYCCAHIEPRCPATVVRRSQERTRVPPVLPSFSARCPSVSYHPLPCSSSNSNCDVSNFEPRCPMCRVLNSPTPATDTGVTEYPTFDITVDQGNVR